MAEEGDRRREQRFAARIRVRFRSIDELVTSYTGDLSRGGLFVSSQQILPVGTLVQLALELPDGGPAVHLPAKVAYTLDASQASLLNRPTGMGMEFVDVDTAQVGARIATFLTRAVRDDPTQLSATAMHLLVVDDSAAYRAEIMRVFEAAGHRVTVAEHGLDALGKALREPPDAILSDVNMPVMDGWQMLRVLRSRDATRRVPVVFLTTLAGERERIRGYELGVDDYLSKPVDTKSLLLRVARIVARSRTEPSEAGTDESALRGDLGQVSIASLLSFAEAERRTGRLRIRGPRGEAVLGLCAGTVTTVELASATAPEDPFERLLTLLDWTEGRFELAQADVPPSEDALSIQGALLEHARRVDEQR